MYVHYFIQYIFVIKLCCAVNSITNSLTSFIFDKLMKYFNEKQVLEDFNGLIS